MSRSRGLRESSVRKNELIAPTVARSLGAAVAIVYLKTAGASTRPTTTSLSAGQSATAPG
jgi:hypothetical protein